MAPSPVNPSRPLGEERILVVRTRFVGDTVLAIPFLRNLRRAFPAAVIDVLVEPASGGVLADCPYKDELITWSRPPRRRRLLPESLTNLVAYAGWLRGRGYTRAYVLKRALSSTLLVRLAGIPHSVGFAGQGGGLLLSRSVPIAEDRHEVEVFLDQLRADGLPVDDAHNENWVSAATAAKVEALLEAVEDGGRPRVFIAPKSTCWEKQWPLDRLAAVIARLVEEQGCECFLCGGPGDAATHQTLKRLLGPGPASHLHDFSSSLNLRETGGLLARMDLCLGIDTGLLHIAASFGVPVVALFGPTNPNQWRPWGTPCEVIRSPRVMHSRHHRLREVNAASARKSRWPRGEASMDDIGIEEVMAAIDRLLAARLCPTRA